MCERGRIERRRSSGWKGKTSSSAVALATRLPCVSIAPFGSPVVPEVKTTSTRSLAAITAGVGSGAASRARSGSDSIRTSGRPSAFGHRRGLGRGQDQLGAGALGDLGHEFGLAAHVERDEHEPGEERAEEADRPLRPVHAPDQDPVAALQALLAQDACHARREVGQVAVASRCGSGSRA